MAGGSVSILCYINNTEVQTMFRYPTLFCLALFACSQAYAQSQSLHCEAEPTRIVASLKELPGEVQQLLALSSSGTGGIADSGSNFNPSDMIVDPSIPQSRYVTGKTGADCIRVTLERGGRGYHFEQIEFALSAHTWVQISRTNIRPQLTVRQESLAQ
jgi:hypothetical protein